MAAAAGAAGAAAGIGSFAGAVAGEIISALIGDFIDAAGALVRYEVAANLGFIRNWTAEAFDSLVEEDPHSTLGMSPRGMIDVLERMLRATAQIGLTVGAEVAEELFMELIQEGFSNAIQTSLGGSFQALLNIWRGGMPPNPDEVDVIIGKVADIDEDTLTLMLAMSGSNIPTTFLRVSRAFDLYVDNELKVIKEQLIDVLNRANQAIAWLYEVARNLSIHELEEALSVIKEAYNKGINILDQVGERALSRLQELKIECMTAKEWFSYSQLYPETPLITDLELTYVAIENGEEADATFNAYQDIKATVEQTLDTVDVQVDEIVNKINNVISEYVSHLNRFAETGFVKFDEIIAKIENAMKKVIAYRNAVDTQTKIESPVSMIIEYPSIKTTLTFVDNVIASDYVSIIKPPKKTITFIDNVYASDVAPTLTKSMLIEEVKTEIDRFGLAVSEVSDEIKTEIDRFGFAVSEVSDEIKTEIDNITLTVTS